MSTEVTYKGSTLTTATNQTKILKTAGKYLEDDITITDESSGGSAIVVTEETDSHGGIIKHITAVDLSNDTVAPEYLLSGYTAHNFLGSAITGTYSGGVIPTGTINITANGIYDVASYASASVSVGGGTVNPAFPPTMAFNSTTGVITATNTFAGGTYAAGTSASTYTLSIKSSADLTVNGATVTAPAGYYSQAASKAVTTQTAFPPAISLNSSTGVITASNTFTAGYYTAGSSSSTYSLSVQAAKTVTPTESVQRAVSAGYFVTGNVSVAAISSTYVGTGVATKAAATYYTSTADQTIATNQYLTGAQTIKSVTYTGLTASAIASGTTVKIGDASNASRITQVVGTLSFQTYYTGSTAPSSSLGNDGDIYLQS